MEDLNYDTIHGYCNSHRSLKEGHSFERLSDHEYLRSIGAAAISDEDGKLHPMAAGMVLTIVVTGPIILAFPLVQKYFIQGITIGAVKG